jgi:excisionase family DNA binding protein
METATTTHDAIEPVLTLSELAAHLSVTVQTRYDLRSKGRGPRGFRVGSQLRFRQSEVDAWLARLEAADAARHPEALLKERLLSRPGYGNGGLLTLASPFGDLVELWLADLELRDIADNTKDNYRDDLRLHVRPFLEHYTLGEITTGRVEWFLKAERAVHLRPAARRDVSQPG